MFKGVYTVGAYIRLDERKNFLTYIKTSFDRGGKQKKMRKRNCSPMETEVFVVLFLSAADAFTLGY